MKRILFAFLVFAPAIALADKTFSTGKGTAWDCKTDPTVNIMHGNATYTFKGVCKQINVNGGHDTLKIETVTELNVNGGHNVIDVSVKAGTVNVNGSDNTITTKGDKPQVNVLGSNNKINGAGGGGGAVKPEDDDDDKAASGNMIDCAKQADTNIVDNNSSFTFTGPCGKIGVAGNHNTLKIEKAKGLAVPGNQNTVDVVAVDAISVAGNQNTVGWKKGLSKAKPKVSVAGNKNKVAQVK